jgi:hypothetical protein
MRVAGHRSKGGTILTSIGFSLAAIVGVLGVTSFDTGGKQAAAFVVGLVGGIVIHFLGVVLFGTRGDKAGNR